MWRKPREISQIVKTIRQNIPQLIYFNRATAGGTVNLHVFHVRLKQRKVSPHPPSSISPPTISPPPIPPSPNPSSRLIDQLDYLNIKNISVRLPDEVMPTILAQLQQRHKATVPLSSCQL